MSSLEIYTSDRPSLAETEFVDYHETDYLFNLSRIGGKVVGKDLIKPENDDRIFVVEGPMTDLEKTLRQGSLKEYMMQLRCADTNRRIYEVPISARKAIMQVSVSMDNLLFHNTNLGRKIDEFFFKVARHKEIFGLFSIDNLALCRDEDAPEYSFKILLIPF